jgi:3-deoxy-D-manno-octulosonate 8-phosphate phosphatase (KDO 8-P phosphatase)
LKQILSKYTKEQVKKASAIKAIFFDVDGVLTNGKIIYDEAGKEIKQFNVKDGQIVSHLKKAGIILGAISGRETATVTKRMAELKVDFCHQGIVDKGVVFEKLVQHYKLKHKEVVFIGDDINDFPIFKLAGFSACPKDAIDYVKTKVDLVTFAKGGAGVLREVADLVLSARGEMEGILEG